MRRTSWIIVLFALLALGNMLLFLGFQFFLSKKYIFAEKQDLTKFIQEELHITPSKNDVANSLLEQSVFDLQNQVVTTISDNQKSVVNIVITKNLEIFLQDPRGFFGQWSIAQKRTQVGGGSGIIVSKDWLIITNKHVVSLLDADYSVVLNDGRTYQVQNIWRDPLIDLAVISLAVDEQENVQFDPATFIDFNQDVMIGQFVLAIGNALAEYHNSVTLGILSAKNRMLDTYSADSIYVGLYQTDTSINPGNSGGPLLDIFGNVIGINTAVRTEADGIGFALPVNKQFIDATLEIIRTHNSIQRPFIGIQYQDLHPTDAQALGMGISNGTLVEYVVPDLEAEKAWLLSWDVIVAVNEQAIQSDLPFLYHIYQYVPGDTVALTILRNGQKQQLSVVLGKK